MRISLYIAVHPHYKRCIGGMAAAETSTLTLRIEPAVKDALRVAAEGEQRSISNMVEVLICDYCRANGIAIAGAQAKSPGADSRVRSARPIRKRATP